MTTYIYALCCPETNKPRYVGKTKNLARRLRGHILKAKSRQTDHHCANWIRSLLDRGLSPTITVITEVPDGSDWKMAESEAISSYRLAGHDLTNLTGGGEGFHDCPLELLIRRGQSRSRTLKDPVKRAEFVERTKAARLTDAVRKKQSDGVKAAWKDPEKRASLIRGMRTPDATARRAEATRRRMSDPETAAKHKAEAKKRFLDPASLDQLRLAREKRWRDYRLLRQSQSN